MPSPGDLLAFATLSAVIIAVPGPSVLFIVSRGVALGRRAALLTVVGNAAGASVQVLGVAAGLGVVLERSIAVWTIVKLVGAAYLVWLGVQAIRHRRELATATDPTAAAVVSARSVLAEGFVVGVGNPKLIVFLAAFLPQYVAVGGAPAGVQMALLGVVFVLIALALDSCWGVAAGTARRWLARSPDRLAQLGGAGGVTMIGLGVQLALTGRRD